MTADEAERLFDAGKYYDALRAWYAILDAEQPRFEWLSRLTSTERMAAAEYRRELLQRWPESTEALWARIEALRDAGQHGRMAMDELMTVWPRLSDAQRTRLRPTRLLLAASIADRDKLYEDLRAECEIAKGAQRPSKVCAAILTVVCGTVLRSQRDAIRTLSEVLTAIIPDLPNDVMPLARAQAEACEVHVRLMGM